MGQSSITKRVSKLVWGDKTQRILMVGLDAAGKTTVLYKLNRGEEEVVTTIPTIGFNVETLTCKNWEFTVWDVGGKDKIRPLWRHYFVNMNCLVYVVDGFDWDRLDHPEYGSCKIELDRLLREDDMRYLPLLVLVNKQDLVGTVGWSGKGVLTAEQCYSRLGLDQLRPPRPVRVQACSALTGDGLDEGLAWLSEALQNPKAASASAPEKREACLKVVSTALPLPGALADLCVSYLAFLPVYELSPDCMARLGKPGPS